MLAQQALESADTRWLTRAVPAGAHQESNRGSVVQNISAARQALGQKDIQHAMSLVQQTIAMTQQAEAAPTATSPAAGPAGGSPQTQRFGPPGYHAGEKMH